MRVYLLCFTVSERLLATQEEFWSTELEENEMCLMDDSFTHTVFKNNGIYCHLLCELNNIRSHNLNTNMKPIKAE
jgi:hypothetical protein